MSRSDILFEQARQHIPGGVNSPVRAFRGVGGTPVFFKQGKGSKIIDEDGKSYIDYVGSWGPMLLGHNHPDVIAAVHRQVDLGLSFGAPTAVEISMADKVCELVPGMEMVRMVNSGTEATMSAIRVARGYTGRDKIVKFEGCYHGHSDSLLVKAGSGALTLGIPNSPGVPADFAKHTLTVTYNDLESVRAVFAEHGNDIACVIVEPVAGNMNCIPPAPGFLQGLRTLCDEYSSVLIFDEVMTGFRVALGGAQEVYGVNADLVTLGKVIGAGMPVGAFGGKHAIMEQVAPLGPVYQAGTLSGNPVAMTAGLTALELISKPGFHQAITARLEHLLTGLRERANTVGIGLCTNQVGAMFGLFFTEQEEVSNFAQVMACDTKRFNRFFHGMLDEGVYLAPSAFEAGFISSAHNDNDIQHTLDAAEKIFARIT